MTIYSELTSYLPTFYTDILDMEEILHTESEEFELLMQTTEDTLKQAFISTATWELVRWEKIFGIKTQPYVALTWKTVEDSGLTLGDLEAYTFESLERAPFLVRGYQERRTAILAKKRGSEPTTTAVLRELVRSFTQKEVEIVFHSHKYTVVFTFLDNAGVPKGFADAKRAVSEIIPAHLAFEFKNSVTVLWGDLLHTTCANLAAYTVADIKGGLYNA